MAIKETDMKKVQEQALVFLMLDLVKTKSSPAVVQHPYFNNGFIGIRDNETDDVKVANILEDTEAWEQARAAMRKEIEGAETVLEIGRLLTKPYKLTFLKFIEPYISAADMGRYIGRFWNEIEFISMDKDVSKTTLVRLLRKCDKQTMMTDKEREVLAGLVEPVEIYRGVTDYNKKHDRSLCWTTSIEVARWYANRFNQGGYVYKGNIKKADILAYLEDEETVIVDHRRLTNMVMIEKISACDEVEPVEV